MGPKPIGTRKAEVGVIAPVPATDDPATLDAHAQRQQELREELHSASAPWPAAGGRRGALSKRRLAAWPTNF